jgi:hypothetical protein
VETLQDVIRLAVDESSPGSRAELDREVRSGRLTRVCTGAYVATELWRELDARQRHLVVAHVAQLIRRRRLVFSHWTAAAAWHLPVLGEFPRDAHALAVTSSGGRSDERLVRHCTGIPAATERVAGLEVTTLARTVVDLARVAPIPAGVVAADAALRGDPTGRYPAVGRDLLSDEIGAPGRRGAARARQVVEFADARSGSPGESLSRASMLLAGIPAPLLQFEFSDRFGVIVVDFWWPEFNLVGEFDGRVKYEDPVYLAGRTPQEALLDEKFREDRIRALGPRVTRWRWDVALSPGRLRSHLVAAGIRPERYRNW